MLGFITAGSLLLAIAMTIVAWRAAREERRRADARVAALAAEVDGFADLPLAAIALPQGAVAPGELFERESAATSRPSRTAAAIALAVFVVGSGAALAVVLSGSPAASRAGGAVPAKITAPLELVALGHERDGDRLQIHGVVRNPSGAAPVDDLTAVVFLFDRDGRFATSASAPIDNADLVSGASSRFSIVVPAAVDVARYRVSFRTDRGIVGHVDRRVPTESTR